MPSSRASSQPRDWTHVSYISFGKRIPYHWTSWVAYVSKWEDSSNYFGKGQGNLATAHFWILMVSLEPAG